MTLTETLTVLAILLSPAIALGVSIWMRKRNERLQYKKAIFTSLMATRHKFDLEEKVRALNLIDVVFHDDKEVRKIWREYFDMLGNPGLNNELGWKQRGIKNLELIRAMAKASGYGKNITHIDVDRVYLPVGLMSDAEKAMARKVEAKLGTMKKKKAVKKKTQKKKK